MTGLLSETRDLDIWWEDERNKIPIDCRKMWAIEDAIKNMWDKNTE